MYSAFAIQTAQERLQTVDGGLMDAEFANAVYRRLELAIETWLHNELDRELRPTPGATMRWQWCLRPNHPEDTDCACCLSNPPYDFPCGCICHDRVRSLVRHIMRDLGTDMAFGVQYINDRRSAEVASPDGEGGVQGSCR